MSSQHSRQSIGLCMIVRNESQILERCLRSVADWIDTWTICDTGSTDGTPDVIRSVLGAVPGELHESEWADFAVNRSELMVRARGSADYLLLIDADMTVRVREPVPQLDADAYLLRETGELDFGVIRLVRGDRHWWYEGSTHEYIATDGRFEQEQLDALAIEHHADGAARWEKLIRDVGLLKRDIARDPDNARPVFYLAQTYRDLGRPELAIASYRRRVEMGGWDEEVFYANLQEGILRAERDLDAAVPVLLEAFQRRPTRAEPLYELARAHRLRGDFAIAHMFASRAVEIPYPSDILFIHRALYQWGLALEWALAAAGLGWREAARDELERLLEERELPAGVHRDVRRSLEDLGRDQAAGEGHASSMRRVAGEDRVERLAALAPSLRIGEVKLDVRPAWPAFNPSIAADGDGFRMIVRTANYAIERGVLHSDGVLQNINYLVELGEDLGVREIQPIVDRAQGPRRFESRIQGYEDCRLVRVGDRWLATATVCDLNPSERREIALLELDDAAVASVQPLAGPDHRRHEKNWMPFAIDDALHVLYRCGPTIVLRFDAATGETNQVAEHEAPPAAHAFRGGSQGLALEQGQLFVVHEVQTDGSALRYLHRFVLLGRDLRLAALTPPFTFTSDRVEFCAGIARRGDELVLSFGVSDAAAGLAVLDLAQALALLEPIA